MVGYEEHALVEQASTKGRLISRMQKDPTILHVGYNTDKQW